MKFLSRSTLLFVFLLPSTAFSQTQPTPVMKRKPRITVQNLTRLFRKGNTIENRTISPSAILLAFSWVTEHETKEKQSSLRLSIRNSIIEDDDDARQANKSRESSEKYLVGSKDELPEELRSEYDEDNTRTFVRFPIDVQNSVIKRWDATSFYDPVFTKRVSFHSCTFEGYTNFSHAIFLDRAQFSAGSFKDDAEFTGAVFQSDAVFGGTDFQGNAVFAYTVFNGTVHFINEGVIGTQVNFNRASFGKDLVFSFSRLKGIALFNEAKFYNDLFFIDLNRELNSGNLLQGNLQFFAAKFYGRLYFTNARVDTISFLPQKSQGYNLASPELISRVTMSPSTISKRAVFNGLRCNGADFRDVEFHDYVDFSNAEFYKTADFSSTSFDGAASFYRTTFPQSTLRPAERYRAMELGLFFDGTTFQQPTNLTWGQIGGRVITTGVDTWGRLEEIFKRSGNLEGQNEAMYQRRLEERKESKGLWKATNRFEFLFWGYGIRPLRLVGWLILVFLAFTTIYWTQTSDLEQGRSKWPARWKRIFFALAFSARTSWTLGYGYQHSRTWLFRSLTIIHSAVFKVMLVCLLKVLANISPLLNELVGKLLPL